MSSKLGHRNCNSLGIIMADANADLLHTSLLGRLCRRSGKLEQQSAKGIKQKKEGRKTYIHHRCPICINANFNVLQWSPSALAVHAK